MINFYDTNALLYNQDFQKQHFLISDLTFVELEKIKNDIKKDPCIKYKARRLINWLIENEDQYTIIFYKKDWDDILKTIPILLDNFDSRIILSAIQNQQQYALTFITYDLTCYKIAKTLGLKVKYPYIKNQDEYTGYKEIICTDDDLNCFYSSFNNLNSNIYNLLINEYLIIKSSKGDIIDIQKFLGEGNGYVYVPDYSLNSKMFGKIKPKDIYQKIAIDCLKNNKISVIRGAAGAGKSLLSLAFLFEKLEKEKIDKIIIFCNTVATQGSAKLGYYPGSRDEKLLDSQIGNFLVSKLGDKIAVQKLIDDGKLVLLPMSDIRGFDTSGMRAGIYITEAQNMSIELMKLALQRVGEDCYIILDGDSNAQVDLNLYSGANNGLKRVSDIFKGNDIYGEVTLQKIYRSKIAEIAEKM